VSPKLQELIRTLEAAGFKNRGGKGSHRNFVHPNVAKSLTLFQESRVMTQNAIKSVQSSRR